MRMLRKYSEHGFLSLDVAAVMEIWNGQNRDRAQARGWPMAMALGQHHAPPCPTYEDVEGMQRRLPDKLLADIQHPHAPWPLAFLKVALDDQRAEHHEPHDRLHDQRGRAEEVASLSRRVRGWGVRAWESGEDGDGGVGHGRVIWVRWRVLTRVVVGVGDGGRSRHARAMGACEGEIVEGLSVEIVWAAE